MHTKQIAVIDIGSNSIRYMEAEMNENGFFFGKKQVVTTRLASGLVASGLLSDSSMDVSLDVIRTMAENAHKKELPVWAYATSAVRDAGNSAVFQSLLRQHCPSVSLEILPGDMEAKLAFRGAAGHQGGLIDIGGGSSQVITENYAKSFPLGCVRVKDLCPVGSDYETIVRHTAKLFEDTYHFPCKLPTEYTAVGGTATTLAACSLGLHTYLPEKVSSHSLNPEELHDAILTLDRLGPHGRKEHPLLSKRHDVILCGCAILEHLVKKLHITKLCFSDADGLEGYAMYILSK